eukprot:gene5725-6309_t
MSVKSRSSSIDDDIFTSSQSGDDIDNEEKGMELEEEEEEREIDLIPSDEIQSVPSSAISEDRSVFTSDVASTMETLRNACEHLDQTDLAQRAFNKVTQLCKSRFNAKSRLSASGAADHLAMLFNKWKGDATMVVQAATAVSQFVSGETDNKMAMGVLHVCEDVVQALEAMRYNHPVVQVLCRLISDLCNSILKGLPKKYFTRKPLARKGSATFQPLARIEEEGEDFLFSDNRHVFGQAGACELLTGILHDLSARDGPLTEENIQTSIQACETIATLAANQENCVAFGEAGIAKAVINILADRFPASRSIAALWVMIILCADTKSGNKERFTGRHACKQIVDFLYDIERAEKDYREGPLFPKLVDHLGWAMLNLIIGCPVNEKAIQSISYARQAIRAVLDLDGIKPGYKQKLMQAYKKVYP